MPASINSHRPKYDKRAQRLAQQHLNRQEAPADKALRAAVLRDEFTILPAPAAATPTHGSRGLPVNARTLLTAGTFLALLTGGQAAAALAVGGPGSAPAEPLLPVLNRRAGRRLLQPGAVNPATTDAAGGTASVTSPPPPPSGASASLPRDLLTRVLQGPGPYSQADLVAFTGGASVADYLDFEGAHSDALALLGKACAGDLTRILAAAPPFSNADLTLFGRVCSQAQWNQLLNKFPEVYTAFQDASKALPIAETFAPAPPPPPVPPPPAVPAGPPVKLAAAGVPDPNAFLKVLPGTPPQFTTGAGPLRLVGYNVATPGTGDCNVPLSDFASLCANVAANGGNSLRMFAFQSMGGPGNWQGFDSALATARAHGLKIDWVLGNQWTNCEKVEPDTAPDGYHEPAWYTTGYKQAGGGNPLSYRDFALATVQRYRNDSTLGIWSLLNEAEAGTVGGSGTSCPDEGVASRAMTGFVADMASAIRAIDTNHLLALGTRGQDDNCGLQGSHYLSVQAPLDVLTLHSYDVSYTWAQNLTQQAGGVGKPLILSEHARCADDSLEDCSPSTDPLVLQARACEMEKFAVGLAGLGVAGELPWYMQAAGGEPDGYSLSATDPLVARLKKFAAGGSLAVNEAC